MGILLLYLMYFDFPGWYRYLTPERYGVSQIGPRIYTDDPSQSEKLLALVRNGQKVSKRFFGERNSNPYYILCTTQKCKEDFGIGALGEAVHSRVILISPRGLLPVVLAHEQAHIDLHTYFGLVDFHERRYPVWFDEGLASFVSEPGRIRFNEPDFDFTKLRRIETTFDWQRSIKGKTWSQSYGSARSGVAFIERKIGREGLLRFIASVRNRADFDRKLDIILSDKPADF